MFYVLFNELDPNGWETVPRLPDHDIMVGGPEHRPSTPVIHVQQHTSGGGATGVQDVMIDLAARPGGAIIQTFFGERSPEMDDDDREDFDDKYDLDDDDEKRGRDNDNDDDRDGKKKNSLHVFLINQSINR